MKKILAVLLAAGLLGGCGQQSTTASTAASTSEAAGEASSTASSDAPESSVAEGTVSQASHNGKSKPGENGLLGRVTAIDGNVITLESMGGGKRPDGELRESVGGKPAGAPEASGAEKPPIDQDKTGAGPDKGEAPKGGEQGTTPERKPEDGKQGTPPTGAPGNKEAETVSVTLPDDCEVLLERQGENTAGTAADIVVGGMIRITYAEDGETVQTVTVMEEREPQEAPQLSQDGGTPEAAEQAAPEE